MNSTPSDPVTNTSGMPAARSTSNDPNIRIDNQSIGTPRRLPASRQRNVSSP